jgi:muramidase (phage lysozyme)
LWEDYLADNITKPSFPVHDGTIVLKEQITHTNYDETSSDFIVNLPRYGRNRITSTYTQDVATVPTVSGLFKVTQTAYWYDVHGNVKHLAQQVNREVVPSSNVSREKHIGYEYDLISGKVNKVYFQQGESDQFIHRYRYDADNRLTQVETSVDDFFYATDATYFYYPHGPLSRIELGHYKIQGIDYAYTLQGWLKGVNSLNDGTDLHLPENDMGADGLNTNQIHHRKVGKDVFGFTLHYFNGDYKPIGTVSNNIFDANITKKMYTNHSNSGSLIPLPPPVRSLYNGNIAAMRTAIHTPDANNPTVKSQNPIQQLMAYRYDQLNRLTQTRNLELLSGKFNLTDNYQENYSYDPNGNILRLDRTNGQGQQFDNLHYGYDISVNNQLRQVEDEGTDPHLVSNDLDRFESYAYDEIGNLVYLQTDTESSTMTWNIYGKLARVVKTNANIITTITYTYNATGNRVHKEVTKEDNSTFGTDISTQRTVYWRDAQGNVLQTHSYSSTYDISTGLVQKQTKEYVIYGSSRLGTYSPEHNVYNGSFNRIGDYSLTLGYKHYELSNHLGNVLTTIADNWSLNTEVRVLSTQDYYPFGMAMTERSFVESVEKKYRWGFNNQEIDNDLGEGATVFKYRVEDVRIGKFWSVDPLAASYPWNSPYAVTENSPIGFIELEGLEKIKHIVIPGETVVTIAKAYSNQLKYSITPHMLIEMNPGIDKGLKIKQELLIPDKPQLTEAEANVRAMLTVIRETEGVGLNPYDSQFGGHTFGKKGQTDEEKYATHPNKETESRWETKGKDGKVLKGSVAGAYQIKPDTYRDLIKVEGVSDNFHPATQDLMAVALMSRRTDKNGTSALELVKSGKIEEAFTVLADEWTSLPGASQQTTKKQDALNTFNEAKSKEMQGKSSLATPQGKLNLNVDYKNKKKG